MNTEKRLRVRKENKYLVFTLPNEKEVKYDLATGETIGILGRPVKSLQSQLRGYHLLDVIEGVTNEGYKKFLRYVSDNFVNDCRNGAGTVSRVSNVGTFLKKIPHYSMYEQYFAAGIYTVRKDLTIPMDQVPKQLLKLCRKYKFGLNDRVVMLYKDMEDPTSCVRNIFSNIMNVSCDSITPDEKIRMLRNDYRFGYENGVFLALVNRFAYKPTSLIKYIDNLVTYEALELNEAVRELYDYSNMQSGLSAKYEKYPKNFLTSHRIAVRNYNRLKQTYSERKFLDGVDKSLEWEDDSFVVRYPESTQDIKDEAVQQNNCLASYIENVINGHCHIMFMRERTRKDESLVTLEIKGNKVVQAKGKSNRDLYPRERESLLKYNKYLGRKNKINTEQNMVAATV